jgi:hypothetical protein
MYLVVSSSRLFGFLLQFDIYRKPTDTQMSINADSFHHPSHKHAAFHSMIFRLFNVPLSDENFKKELQYIRETGRMNGVEDKVIEKIFQKHRKKSMLKEITSLNPNNREKETTRYVGIPYYGNLTEKLRRKLRQRNNGLDSKTQENFQIC